MKHLTVNQNSLFGLNWNTKENGKEFTRYQYFPLHTKNVFQTHFFIFFENKNNRIFSTKEYSMFFIPWVQ